MVLDTLNPAVSRDGQSQLPGDRAGRGIDGLPVPDVLCGLRGDQLSCWGRERTPTTVTVAYDRMDEAAAYDLYVREHDTGTYGTEAH